VDHKHAGAAFLRPIPMDAFLVRDAVAGDASTARADAATAALSTAATLAFTVRLVMDPFEKWMTNSQQKHVQVTRRAANNLEESERLRAGARKYVPGARDPYGETLEGGIKFTHQLRKNIVETSRRHERISLRFRSEKEDLMSGLRHHIETHPSRGSKVSCKKTNTQTIERAAQSPRQILEPTSALRSHWLCSNGEQSDEHKTPVTRMDSMSKVDEGLQEDLAKRQAQGPGEKPEVATGRRLTLDDELESARAHLLQQKRVERRRRVASAVVEDLDSAGMLALEETFNLADLMAELDCDDERTSRYRKHKHDKARLRLFIASFGERTSGRQAGILIDSDEDFETLQSQQGSSGGGAVTRSSGAVAPTGEASESDSEQEGGDGKFWGGIGDVRMYTMFTAQTRNGIVSGEEEVQRLLVKAGVPDPVPSLAELLSWKDNHQLQGRTDFTFDEFRRLVAACAIHRSGQDIAQRPGSLDADETEPYDCIRFSEALCTFNHRGDLLAKTIAGVVYLYIQVLEPSFTSALAELDREKISSGAKILIQAADALAGTGFATAAWALLEVCEKCQEDTETDRDARRRAQEEIGVRLGDVHRQMRLLYRLAKELGESFEELKVSRSPPWKWKQQQTKAQN